MTLPSTLADHVEALRALQGALLDAWVVVRAEAPRSVVAYNRPFFAMLPRRVARRLEERPLTEVMHFELAHQPLDLAEACLEQGRAVRYDEVHGHAQGEGGDQFNLIAAAAPLIGGQGLPVGVLVVLRDVTDEAQVQTKYQQMLSDEAERRAGLEEALRRRTQELLAANDSLNAMQRELMDYKKGLLLER